MHGQINKVQEPNSDVLDELRALEASLWSDSQRFDRAHMDDLLHPSFFEVGQSGRRYSREDIIGVPHRPINASEFVDFKAFALGESVVVLTYAIESAFAGIQVITRRLSIWSNSTGRWLLCYHQGTPGDHAVSQAMPPP